jgi:outer membrane protein assembly factor BamB
MKPKISWYSAIWLLLVTGCAACDINFHSSEPWKNKPVDPVNEPAYTAKIVWEADTSVSASRCNIQDGEYIYVYNNIEGLAKVALTKLDIKTGVTVWMTVIARPTTSPIVIDNFIYVLCMESYIVCINKNDGNILAGVSVDVANQSLVMNWNIIANGNYLYFGIGNYAINTYFARLDVNLINKDGNVLDQNLEAEVLWRSQYDLPIASTPVIHNNVIFVHTFIGNDIHPVELAGINMDTLELVFYKQFGVKDNEQYERGRDSNSLFVHNDTLYFISSSISAYNLNTGKLLYLKTFSNDTPPEKNYAAIRPIEITYNKDKLYYTTEENTLFGNNRYKNIFCVDAKTGNLVWSDIPPKSEALKTNPIIAHNRMYVPHGYGLRVYNPDTGQLIGVDKNFEGEALGRNILYGDLMITTRYNPASDRWQTVAVYVGE